MSTVILIPFWVPIMSLFPLDASNQSFPDLHCIYIVFHTSSIWSCMYHYCCPQQSSHWCSTLLRYLSGFWSTFPAIQLICSTHHPLTSLFLHSCFQWFHVCPYHPTHGLTCVKHYLHISTIAAILKHSTSQLWCPSHFIPATDPSTEGAGLCVDQLDRLKSCPQVLGMCMYVHNEAVQGHLGQLNRFKEHSKCARSF